jgi:hypothetical protein
MQENARKLNMSRLNEYRRVWRVAVLVLLLVAITGPWTFEVVWVPSEPPFSPCSAPYIRLDDDFCGAPQSGVKLLRWMGEGFVYASEQLATGGTDFIEWTRGLVVGLLLFLIVLPLFSTLLLILRGDGKGRRVFSIAACGIATGIGLLIGISSYPRQFVVLWGVWLYTGLATGTLILEVLALVKGRKLDQVG